MIQIIETNLMLNEKLNNFKSRVIEVESWDYVIEQFVSKDIVCPKVHYDIHNRYSGVIVPRMAVIENLEYDDNKLSCNVLTYNGHKIRKLIERFY